MAKWRIIVITLGTLLFLGLVSVTVAVSALSRYLDEPNTQTEIQTLIFPKGTSTTAIINSLGEKRILNYPVIFRIVLKVMKDKQHFIAGEYNFEPRITPRQIYKKLVKGEVIIRKVTLAEGLTSHQIIDIINAAEGLEGEITIPLTEGELLPETYHYTYGDSRDSVVVQMKEAMVVLHTELWNKRATDLPFDSWEKALTLASIVEKETGAHAERGRVAAVFVNRLKKNMPLQSDPTVIYALTLGKTILDRPLTKADLATASPYNTYTTYGLPPHPIANPGKATIEAVLNPPQTTELYFVADGKGGHNFASTLKEHNKNVSLFRKLQKEAKQQ